MDRRYINKIIFNYVYQDLNLEIYFLSNTINQDYDSQFKIYGNKFEIVVTEDKCKMAGDTALVGAAVTQCRDQSIRQWQPSI